MQSSGPSSSTTSSPPPPLHTHTSPLSANNSHHHLPLLAPLSDYSTAAPIVTPDVTPRHATVWYRHTIVTAHLRYYMDTEDNAGKMLVQKYTIVTDHLRYHMDTNDNAGKILVKKY